MKRYRYLLVLMAGAFLSNCQPKNSELMLTKELKSGWMFNQAGKNEWLPASVPGCVHTDLMANGKIDDPYYRLNEKSLQWIDKLDWEYQTTFNIDKEYLARDRIALDFKGLDTYARISVNGQQVAATENMFREYLVDVKSYLKEGENTLLVKFLSPIQEGLKRYDANGFVIPVSDNDLALYGEVKGGKKVSIYSRKAGYHFGWDWGPRLTTSGIWRPVYLQVWDEVRIDHLQVIQHEMNDSKANFTASLELQAEAKVDAVIKIENDGELLALTEVKLEKGKSVHQLEFEIADPKLWWTNGLGEQPLYTIKTIVQTGKGLAEESTRIGIRTLELVRDKDEYGTSFYFKLNGIPVFMKGANYIPNDAFLPRVTAEKYCKVVNTAKESNMNMLRVWGGGTYEDDKFYDYCDESGILVWQDFMFACAMYPGDSAFLKNVEAEVEDNIKRLRNHPSLGLWCGNNEVLDAWLKWGWKKQEEAKNKETADKIYEAYEAIFHKILPEAVKKYDPKRPYWSASPSAGEGLASDLNNGDDHYWGVWWGKEPFQTYATHIARFMSEYGFQSFPEMKTVKQFAVPDDYDIYSDVMKAHQRSSIGNETIEYYMLKDYRKPRDFESFLYVNQVLQAEGIKFALEGHRRAMPFCMGSLYWQINDCWPVASWSSTDYYQRWKALQYYAKKGFAPVLVSPFVSADSLKVGIVNDELHSINAELQMQVVDFNGKQIWKDTFIFEIPENSSQTCFDEALSEFLKGKDIKNQLLETKLSENGKVIAENVFYFTPVKDLYLPKPNVTFKIEPSEGGFNITLKTDKLAKNVYLTMGDEEGFFSDNYFDMLPNSSMVVNLKTACSAEVIDKVFSIRTLDDTY